MGDSEEYIFDDDNMRIISDPEYCSDESDSDSNGEEYYDKNGRRHWRKTKDKGDDKSKAINWKSLYPNFDYDQFNQCQQELSSENKNISEPKKTHSMAKRREIFKALFDRWPGECRRWAYVRNISDCDYHCKFLLESPKLPVVVGVDVEMENDGRPFREWSSKWRTIRAHSRGAKGMFARIMQISNCAGLVVVFDLVALARPHNWNGGIDCDSKLIRFGPRVSLPTSTLPQSLVNLILDPRVIRFGWALHCDWSSIYNSFGLLVPQKSYLDAQTPWRHVLRDDVDGVGNGLADAASALFGISLDKRLRGYGHFWHGMAPSGKIPRRQLEYAVKDAQTSLDVALQILVLTNWLSDWANVWPGTNVQSQPMPGVRKRISSFYGKKEKEGEIIITPMSNSSDNEVGIGDNHGDTDFGQDELELDGEDEFQNDGEVSEDICRSELEVDQLNEENTVDLEIANKGDVDQDKGSDHVQRKVAGFSSRIFQRSAAGPKRETDIIWNQLRPSIRKFIIASKYDAQKILDQLSKDNLSPCTEQSECPAFLYFLNTRRYFLKRMLLKEARAQEGSRCDVKEVFSFYRKARQLLDRNLDWAWRSAKKKFEP